LFTQSGTHMIVDVTGWYLGSPDLSSLPPPANPSTATTMGVRIDAPSGGIGVNIGYATTSAAIDAVVDGGRAVLYGGNGTLGGPDHNIYFAHRTQISAGRPFTNIHRMAIGDTFTLAGQDGRRYKYLVTVGPSVIHGTDAQGLINLVLSGGPVTATLVACHPPTSTTYRILVVGRLIGLA
jgi:sortase (surface protein transpeptidase)